MSELDLIPGEHVLMTSDRDVLTLTNRRVRYNAMELGASSFISVTLDAVASVGFVTRSYPRLLFIGPLLILAGLALWDADQKVVAALFVGGIACVIGYFATRKAVVTIASTGGHEIVVPTRGVARAQLIEFLDGVEFAKLSRGQAPGQTPRPGVQEE